MLKAKHRGLEGHARCDLGSGIYKARILREHCAGDCVAQHEQAHVDDMSLCCARYARCYEKGKDVESRQACHHKWEEYDRHNEDWSECNAYQVEFDCLLGLLNNECAKGTVSEECCQQLDKEHELVTQRIGEHCPKSLPWPCPFSEDGNIIKGF
jgi:hypothetical protein